MEVVNQEEIEGMTGITLVMCYRFSNIKIISEHFNKYD